MKILILGARGNIGSHIASSLSGESRVNLYLSSHSENGMAELASRFPAAQTVKVDINDSESVANAVKGMNRIVVVSPDFTNEEVATGNLIAALADSDSLQQVIRVTGLWPGVTEEAVPAWMREKNMTCWQHLTARRLLKNSGLPVTLVNPVSRYMQNYLNFIGPSIRDQHIIAYPYPQTLPHIDTRDIAEVIVHLLQQDAKAHVGREYDITGAKEDVLSCAEVAAMFTSELGFTVEYSDDVECFCEMQGGDRTFADYLQWQQQTYGDVDSVTNYVSQFLGREPRTLRDWIHENADYFKSA